jgi:hypothetical protein
MCYGMMKVGMGMDMKTGNRSGLGFGLAVMMDGWLF